MCMPSYVEKDHLARLLGVELVQDGFAAASCRLHLAEAHRNGLGTVHGAVIFALADITFASACNAGDATYIGLLADIRYLNQAEGDELVAHAELVRTSGRFAHYRISVNDATGNRVAMLSASAYRLSRS